jgi:nitrite reductase/ring-hydroxylating ferredoxin subunit
MLTRRLFLGGTVGAACACAAPFSNMPKVASGYRVAQGKLVLDLGAAPALSKVGGSVKIALDTDPQKVAVARVSDERFVAFVNRCTDWGGELNYLEREQALECAGCEHARFDLEGRAMRGPSSRPLRILQARVVGGTLEIALS